MACSFLFLCHLMCLSLVRESIPVDSLGPQGWPLIQCPFYFVTVLLPDLFGRCPYQIKPVACPVQHPSGFLTVNSQCLVFLWMVKLLQNARSYLSNAANGRKNSSVVPRGHQLMPWSRRFHYPYFFPLGYMTASVICSHKIFQLKFETQSTLFVSVTFLWLQIPLLCYALDTAIAF